LKKSENKETQNLTEFKPTNRQVKFLEAYLLSETGYITEISKKCGVSRTTIYEWRRDPAFVKWFNGIVDAAMKGRLPDIWMAVARRAKKNHNDSKLYFERFDEDYSEKKKVDWEGSLNTQNEIKITVIKTGDKEET